MDGNGWEWREWTAMEGLGGEELGSGLVDVVHGNVADAGVVEASVAEGGARAVVETGAAREVAAHDAVRNVPGIQTAVVRVSENSDDGGLHGGGNMHEGGIIGDHESAAINERGADTQRGAVYREDVARAL